MDHALTHLPVHAIVGDSWLVFFIVWVVGALRTKSTRLRQPGAVRLTQLALGGVAYWLVVERHWSFWRPLRWLERPVLPASGFVVLAGLVLLLGGIGFAFAARFALGRNWSSDVTLKAGHTLILTGPYAVVRNPIYTGILSALLGTAVLLNAVHAFLGCGLLCAIFVWKVKREESFMQDEFGAEYTAYRRRVKGFIPYIW